MASSVNSQRLQPTRPECQQSWLQGLPSHRTHCFLTWLWPKDHHHLCLPNEVTLRRARLVLGWVTVSGFNSRCGPLSQSNQPTRSTQHGHPSVGRRSEYRPKGGDALRLEVKADMALFAGNTVWSISERVRDVCIDALHKSTLYLLYYPQKG